MVEFLKKNAKWVWFGIFLICCIVTFKTCSYIDSSKQVENAELNDNNIDRLTVEQLKKTVKKLNNEIDKQNDVILRLQKEGEDRLTKHAVNLKLANIAATKHITHASELMSVKEDSNASDCENAKQLFDLEIVGGN